MKYIYLIIAIYLAGFCSAQNPIKVNQFGYRPKSSKVAVLTDPQIGFNASESYTPSSTIELRRSSDDAIVFSGAPEAWNNGATHDQSGDKVWWFDFSDYEIPGKYYLYDPVNIKTSYAFDIGEDVYQDVLKQVMRAFYYQRSGFEKIAPYAESGWTDQASFQGTDQDKFCRLVTDKNNASTAKDLSGGWYDAGDYNKYVNFCFSTLHNLLFAFEQNPEAFKDNYNIPESGNGIPDILDEVKWELDWLLKMQLSDGSVLMKVSHPNFEAASPPSADNAPTYYGKAQQSSTLTFCSIMSHAAIVLNSLNDPDWKTYADLLNSKALLAWNWLNANPGYSDYDNSGFASANPEVTHYDQDMMKLTAAVFLFELTNQSIYKTYIDNHYTDLHGYQWGFWYPYEEAYQEALLRYTANPNSTSSVSNNILNSFSNSVNNSNNNLLPAYINKSDAYRAYLADQDYVWGSNQVKSQTGMMFTHMDYYDLDTINRSKYLDAAEQYIHFISGVNPLALVLMTHMDNHGGENSIREIYHSWFGDGTDFDNASTSLYGPPPGYLPGGFNIYYHPDAAYSGPPISPPTLQPTQKSYKDWNTSWPENSWEIAEVSIYVQAAFARLLSYFTKDEIITSTTEQKSGLDQFILSKTISENDLNLTDKSGKQNEKNIRIVSTQGTIYKTIKSTDNQVKLNISDLKQGLYFVTVKTGTNQQTLKFIKL